MTLYWGARQRVRALFRPAGEMGGAEPALHYIPVISDAVEPGMRHGFVHQAVLEDHPSLADFQAYVCGVPVMTHAARRDFVQAGLPETRLLRRRVRHARRPRLRRTVTDYCLAEMPSSLAMPASVAR